jgi:hypothetical protein
VLFGFVAATALLALRRRDREIPFVRLGAIYALTAAAVVVPAYGAAVAALHFSATQAYDWFTGYATAGKWGKAELADLPKAAIGAGRALVGGHFLFAIVPRHTALHAFRGKLVERSSSWSAARARSLPLCFSCRLSLRWRASPPPFGAGLRRSVATTRRVPSRS